MVWSIKVFCFFLKPNQDISVKKKTFKKVFLVLIESIKSSPDVLHSYMNIGTNGKKKTSAS